MDGDHFADPDFRSQVRVWVDSPSINVNPLSQEYSAFLKVALILFIVTLPLTGC